MKSDHFFSFVFILLLMIVHPLPILAEKIPVALLPLELAGIDRAMSVTLTDRLRAELLKTERFEVMERDRMNEILIEQGFQQTGACNTDECIVEAGRMLGVSKILAGSIGKVGSIFSITIRIIDVETAQILLITTEDSPGPIESVLTVSLKKVAEKLATLAAAMETRLISYGSLSLSSTPDGARIIIDDHIIPGVTPLTIDSVKTGIHVIRMQKDLLAASKAVFIAPKEKTIVDLTLTLARGSLKIVTDPPEVSVYLDYKLVGVTPKEIYDLAVGAYNLKLIKKGYIDYSKIVSIREKETTLVTSKMLSMAYFSVTTNPPDCKVSVDDSLIGIAPLDSVPIKPGFHKINVIKSGFVGVEETRSFSADELTTINVVLDPAATLVINSDPSEADVYVNGFFQGTTPLRVPDLREGLANIELKMKYYEDQSQQILITKGETKTIEIALSKKKGKLIVQSIPSEARVEINGQLAGTTPLELNEIEFGVHVLTVSKESYKTHEERIEISDYLPKTVHVKFEIAKGTLFLHPNPKDAVLYLDGKKINEVPTTGMTLLPGEYLVVAKRPGYEKFNSIASIKPNDGLALKIDLQPKTRGRALMRSLFIPGWGQRYAEKHSRTHLFFISELGTLAGMIITGFIYDDHLDSYEASRDTYRKAIALQDIQKYRAEMLEAYDKLERTKQVQDKFMIGVFAVWALNIIDSMIFSPIKPVIVADGVGLNYLVIF